MFLWSERRIGWLDLTWFGELVEVGGGGGGRTPNGSGNKFATRIFRESEK